MRKAFPPKDFLKLIFARTRLSGREGDEEYLNSIPPSHHRINKTDRWQSTKKSVNFAFFEREQRRDLNIMTNRIKQTLF